MTEMDALRVGWCPGALRPMAAGDGLILRVKPRSATLDLATARALAQLSIRYGNGQIDLTGRANLQLRGIRDAGLDAVTAGLDRLRLLDSDPEAEAIRNTVVSPLAGLDPAAAFDIRPLVDTLEQRFAATPGLRRLPAKWSVVIDDGGTTNLADISADLRIEAIDSETVDIGLGRDPARARCRRAEAVEAAVLLALVALSPERLSGDNPFPHAEPARRAESKHGNIVRPSTRALRTRLRMKRSGDVETATEPARMDVLVRAVGADALFTAAGLQAHAPAVERTPMAARDLIGYRTNGALSWLGLGVPFGAMRAEALLGLVHAADQAGVTALRLTPWRSLLLPSVSPDAAARVAAALKGVDWILTADDPRLAVAACSGAPACHRGTTPVRHHAAILAETLRPASAAGIAIHVSGCAKGCAHSQAAPITLVGSNGRYGVVRDGRAGDPPVAGPLTFQEALDWLSRSPERDP